MSSTPPNNEGHVLPGKVTAFDKGQYDNLIAWVDGVDQDLNKNLNKPRSGVRLDESLGGGISPGSPDWNVAQRFVSKATEFGKSWVERSAELDKDWEGYIAALRRARDVFEDTDDLSKYKAAKFLNDYPDMSPSSNGGGPGGNLGGGGFGGGGLGGGGTGGGGGGTGNNSGDGGTGGKSGGGGGGNTRTQVPNHHTLMLVPGHHTLPLDPGPHPPGSKAQPAGTGDNSGDGGTGGKSGGGDGKTRTQVPNHHTLMLVPSTGDNSGDGGTGGKSGGGTRAQVPDQPLSAAIYRSFQEIPAEPPVLGPGQARPAVTGDKSGGGGGVADTPAPGHALSADSGGDGVAPTPAPDHGLSPAIHRSLPEIPREAPVGGPGEARPAVTGGDSGGGGWVALAPAPGHAVSRDSGRGGGVAPAPTPGDDSSSAE